MSMMSGGLGGAGYIGQMGQQMEQVQESFESLRKKMEADSKAASRKAESEAEAGPGTGVFSPSQGYDYSAAGAWSRDNQTYVQSSPLNMMS